MLERRPQFDAETLELFRRLDATLPKYRAFTEGAHELARRLDLTTEYWTANAPSDQSAEPSYSPEHASYWDWHRCREVRHALLAALLRDR